LLRRLQKIEETSDSFRSLTLTQISVAGDLLLDAINQVIEGEISKVTLKNIFDSIDENIRKQIFELGGVALLNEEKRKKISEFYFAFLRLSKTSISEEFDESALQTLYKEENQDIGGTSISKIKKLINDVQSDLKSELKYYRWRLPLIFIILSGLLTAASVLIAFFQDIITGN
jgi:hypothetical protein